MAKMYIIVELLLYGCICPIIALKCLNCSGISDPKSCTQVQECGENEICGVRQYLTTDGIQYNVGCVNKSYCGQISSPTHSTSSTNGTSLCQECCHGDLCNVIGCGTTGLPADRGPVCYDCDQIKHPSHCNRIKVCGKHESCYYEEQSHLGRRVKTSKCLRTQMCDDLTSGPPVVGRRRELVRSNDHAPHGCTYCCSSDVCNQECHGSNSSQTTARPNTMRTNKPTALIIPSQATITSLGKQFFIPSTAFPFCSAISNSPGNITFAFGRQNITGNFEQFGNTYFLSIFNLFLKLPIDFSTPNYTLVQTSVPAFSVLAVVSPDDQNKGDFVLLLPTTACSTRYIVPSYEPSSKSSVIDFGSLYSDTVVKVTFRSKNGSVNFRGHNFYNGDTTQLTLRAYEVTNMTSHSDMTGTELNSNRPICVLSTIWCAQLGHGQCGVLSDMILPVRGFSDNFIIPVLYSRDVSEIRVLAANDNTSIGFNNQSISLGRGEYYSFYAAAQAPNIIYSTSNILVVLYAMGSRNGGGKPFMMTIPGSKQFLSEYNFLGIEGNTHVYVSVIIPSVAVDGLRLNGGKLPRIEYQDVVVDNKGIEYSILCFKSQNATNVMHHLNGQPFGLFVYSDGIANDTPGFGYAAGLKMT